MWNYSQMISWFKEREGKALLQKADWGIEREAQRVMPTGELALTDHPPAFGNKLTNPRITTDFAESQLELITPPFASIEEMYAELARLHDEVESVLPSELLWPFSMPPRLPSEDLIPIAKYDDSPEGRANAEYREGLAARYGKKMQMISGLHVNFSFAPEFISYIAAKLGREEERQLVQNDMYFALARNFLRYRWLLIYLFGASPTADTTYHSVIFEELDEVGQCFPNCYPNVTPFEEYATSLRVSRYGYSNAGRRDVSVSFDNLQEHIRTFREQLKQTIHNEREFYSSIRLKPHVDKDKTYLDALEKLGVRYAEIRLLDLNPFVREGVDLQQLRMLHVFLIWCLFRESPPISEKECAQINENHHKVSLFGRKPQLILQHYDGNGTILMREWMAHIFTQLRPIADLLDANNNEPLYRQAVEQQHEKVNDINKIVAAQMVHDMKELNYNFIQYGLHLAHQHNKTHPVRSACC